jgi:thiol-disulfide isomerase/thioredoxin
MVAYPNKNTPFYIAAVAICIALFLGGFSWMNLCSHVCKESHSYRLYGYSFEAIGLLFFSLTALMHFFSRKLPLFASLTGWFLSASLGAEIIFLYVQKYKIGAWCPVCLSIAAALTIAATAYFYEYYQSFKNSIESRERGLIMDTIYKGCTGGMFFIFGFIFAFFGIAKQNPLYAAENSVKESIAFGNSSSPMEMYIFTDWRCPACRSLEPIFESTAKKVMTLAKVTFVDDAVHPESLNFTPYNLSFMINNKPRYFELRRALGKLGEETKTPTDQQVETIASNLGVNYSQLHYTDVALGIKYFNHLIKQLAVEGTPTVILVNKTTKKGKKFEGVEEISEQSILNAFNNMNK